MLNALLLPFYFSPSAVITLPLRQPTRELLRDLTPKMGYCVKILTHIDGPFKLVRNVVLRILIIAG